MISAITSKTIRNDNYLEVERCRVTTEIRVKNITSRYDEQLIAMYFGNNKKSGGGKCTCKLTGESEALIKFSDSTGKPLLTTGFVELRKCRSGLCLGQC